MKGLLGMKSGTPQEIELIKSIKADINRQQTRIPGY